MFYTEGLSPFMDGEKEGGGRKTFKQKNQTVHGAKLQEAQEYRPKQMDASASQMGKQE